MLLLSSSMSVFTGSILTHGPATIKAWSSTQPEGAWLQPSLLEADWGQRSEDQDILSTIEMFMTSAEEEEALF